MPTVNRLQERPTGISALTHKALPSLSHPWRVVSSHKWLLLAATIAGGALAGTLAVILTPQYLATSKLLLEAGKNKVVSVDDAYGAFTANREHFQTQFEFLSSRGVAERVVRELNLSKHPLFDPRQASPSALQRVRSAIGLAGPEQPWTEATVLEAVIGRLQADVKFDPVRLTQVVLVGYESPDPELAARVANEFARSFINVDLDTRFRRSQTASGWLNERLASLGSQLEESERALQKFRDSTGIVEAKGVPGRGEDRVLDDMSQRLVAARIERARAEQLYRQVQPNAPGRFEVPEVFSSPRVTRAREVEAAALAKTTELGDRLGRSHPMMQSAQAEVDAARGTLRREAESVIAGIQKEYELAVAKERSLEGAVSASKLSVQSLNRKEIQLAALESEVDTNRRLYQTFLSRSRETGATSDFATPIARLMDPATPPVSPSKPPRNLMIAVGALLGLLLGGAFAWWREGALDVLRSTADVESALQLPLLAAMPLLKPAQLKDGATIQIDEPRSLFAESVRSVLTGVRLSTLGEPNPVIAVTSTLPGEGKSTLASSLALELARTTRVVLVELDFRRPSLGQRLGLDPAAHGFSDLILEKSSLAMAYQSVAGSTLQVITVGRKPGRAVDLLMGPAFRSLIAALRTEFDTVILDTPPIQVVADALVVAGNCTGMVYVVRSNQTSVALAQRNIRRLRTAGARIIGVVMNQHDFEKAERYYGDRASSTSYLAHTVPAQRRAAGS
jgi:succinoglycan biosynthesis transport protein ExoP